MGGQASWFHQLTIALHGLLGCLDERCETGEGLGQLQERMLHSRVNGGGGQQRQGRKRNTSFRWHWNNKVILQMQFQERDQLQRKAVTITCSSSLPPPLFSTSISRQRLRKSLKTGDSLSGFWSSGVPLVAIRYKACQGKREKTNKIRQFQAKTCRLVNPGTAKRLKIGQVRTFKELIY